MSPGTRTYIGSVIALGMAILIGSTALDPHLPNTARFLQLLVLAIMASTFKIRLPRMEGTISLNFVIYLIGIGTLTLTENVLMASLATVAQATWRPKTRPKVFKIMFNVSVLVICVSGAFLAAQQILQPETQVPALIMAATILYVLNSWLISFVVALTSSQSVLNTWRNLNQWTFVYYVMGAGVATLIIAYGRAVGWSQALAMLPATYLMYSYCDTYVSRAREIRVEA